MCNVQSQNSQLLTFIYEGALFVKLYLVPFSNQVSNLLLRNIFLSIVFFSLGFFTFCDFNLTLYYYFTVTVRSCTTMQVGAYHNSQIQCT